VKTRSRGRAAAVSGIVAAMALALAGPAAASTDETIKTEYKCYAGYTLCNRTEGSGNTVYTIRATRIVGPTGKVGFFEAFGPNGYKQTGPTNSVTDHTFIVYRNFPTGSLICVSFWSKNADGSFTKYKGTNGNACTSTPIG
jgi:hypothetical protein